ncbi:restriction endonuclease subunit S [Vibrio cholerae]|uniref:restriction endonuclease subunit S n=1 Tax=Vibrio cholerae TaxID=666 RepID=UPI000E0B58BE|nr:restriction endonuclease subunit S [Vibrio cholerae]GHW70984.1 EcoKI restriction-modification system protein HsdS [Vibrio cholerae]
MNNILSDNLGNLVKAGGGKIHTGPFGSQLHAADYVQEGIPCIMPANMKSSRVDLSDIAYITEGDANRLSKYIVKKDDIVYSRRGDVTLKALIREKEDGYFCGTGCLLLRPGDKFDSRFLTHYLSTPAIQNWIVRQAVGATMPNLNTGILASIPFNGPKKEEQEKIADVLSVIEDKIELNNRINSELEAMAKTLYDYWFVQFDFPDANGKPYKASGGKMVYNDTLKREIPDGWHVNAISDWIRSDKTGDWGKETKQGNYTLQVDCIRGADINGINGQGNVDAPNRFILKKNDHKLLAPFDFVIEISGGSPTQSTGRMAFITEHVLERFDYPLICSNFCKAIDLIDKSYFYNFAYQWQSLYENGVLFGWEGKTSGIKNLLFDSFVSNYNVVMPPKDLAEKFSQFVSPLQEQRQKKLKENAELAGLRDWLLPMLMNGQVTVKPSTESKEAEHG